MGRREDLGDAAIAVVAERGLKGLTHRAVDAAAEVPAGTTSNYFRTRQALVDAVAERIEARDHEVWGTLGPPPQTFEGFTEWLARFATTMAAHQTEVSRVRFALFIVDSEHYAPGHRRFLTIVTQALTAFGIPDADTVATAYLDYLDGMLLHAATVRPDGVPDSATIATNLKRLADR